MRQRQAEDAARAEAIRRGSRAAQEDERRRVEAARQRAQAEERERQRQRNKVDAWRRDNAQHQARSGRPGGAGPSSGGLAAGTVGRSGSSGSSGDGRTGGAGIDRATSSRECAALRAAWGSGPQVRYNPPPVKPTQTIRLQKPHKHWGGFKTRAKACQACGGLVHDHLLSDCAKKGGNGRNFQLVGGDCPTCEEKPGFGWVCTATGSLECVVRECDFELKLRKKIVKALIEQALPTVEGVLTKWLELKSGLSSAVPGSDFLAIGTPLRNLKSQRASWMRQIDQAVKCAGLESMDSLGRKLEQAIDALGRQIQSCQ